MLREFWTELKRVGSEIQQSIRVLTSALRDERVPFAAKLVIFLVVAYAASPVDLIPDFIPVLGLLDDLILLPLGIALAWKLIPNEILDDLREKAIAQPDAKVVRSGLFIVVLLWTLSLVAIVAVVR